MSDVLQFAARTVTAAAPAAGAVDAGTPGKQTTVAGPGAAGAAPPLDRVIAHKGEYVRDARGFTYQVRDDGAFVVTDTPQQLVRSKGTEITPQGRHAARWREIASTIVEGSAAIGALAAEPPPASAAAWFRVHYKHAAIGRPLGMRLATYATCVAARPVLLQQALQASAGDAPAVKVGFEAFADELEVELAAELAAADDAPAIYRAFVAAHGETIAKQPRLSGFRERVLASIMNRIATGADAAAGDRGRTLVDVHFREIVVNHRQDFFAAASNGVHNWRMPPADPDDLQSALSASNALGGGIGGILTEFFEVGALFAAGVGLQVVGIGIGLAQVYMQYQAAAETKRIQIAEEGIRNEVLRGIEAANEAIKQQEDVIAALIAAAAIKAGLDTQSVDRSRLRAFAWTQMFGAMPADATALRVAVTATIKKRLDPHLKK